MDGSLVPVSRLYGEFLKMDRTAQLLFAEQLKSTMRDVYELMRRYQESLPPEQRQNVAILTPYKDSESTSDEGEEVTLSEIDSLRTWLDL